MKNSEFILTAFLLTLNVLFSNQFIAQNPEKMSCRNLVRTTTNDLVTYQAAAMQISVLQVPVSGNAVYTNQS